MDLLSHAKKNKDSARLRLNWD